MEKLSVVFLLLLWREREVFAEFEDPEEIPTTTSHDETTQPQTPQIPMRPAPNVTVRGSELSVTWEAPQEGNPGIAEYILGIACEPLRPGCGCDGVCAKYTERELRMIEGNIYNDLFTYSPASHYAIHVALQYRNGTKEIYTERANITTEAINPNAPTISARSGTSSVGLRWNYSCPYTGPVNYTLTWDYIERIKPNTSEGCQFEVRIPDLNSYEYYSYEMTAVRLNCDSNVYCNALDGIHSEECGVCFSGSIVTLHHVPSPPLDLSASTPNFFNEREESRLSNVTWEGPEREDGDLQMYRISVKSSKDNRTCDVPVDYYEYPTNVDNRICTCDGYSCSIPLKPERNYTIEVQAKNWDNDDFSIPVTAQVRSQAGVPTFLKMKVASVTQDAGNNNLHTTYPMKIFTNSFDYGNGHISEYKIFLKPEDHGNLTSTRNWLPEAVDYKSDGQLVHINKNFTSWVSETFIFGTDGPGNCTTPSVVCNKELKSQRKYLFKIRIYTSRGFADSPIYHFQTQREPWLFVDSETWEIYNDTKKGHEVGKVTVKDPPGKEVSLSLEGDKGLLKIDPKTHRIYVNKNPPHKVGIYNITVVAKTFDMNATKKVHMNVIAKTSNRIVVLMAVIVAITALLLLLLFLFLMIGRSCWRRLQRKRYERDMRNSLDMEGIDAYGMDRRIISPRKADEWEFNRHHLKKLDVIGQGYFADVWKCEAEGMQGKASCLVAVKVLKESATGRERQDFSDELKLLKSIEKHENVVSLLGCCTDIDPIFIILEYMEGGSLEAVLRSARPHTEGGSVVALTCSDLISFMCQVARGMEFLVLKGIIHRDLAARNILLDEKRVCKVADFGCARDISNILIYERQGDDRLPLRWMAPETVDECIHTLQSDVWSFGILMWEIVTLGSTPYPGMRGIEATRLVRAGQRLERPGFCSSDVYGVMLNCWERNPESRSSFTELVCKLDELKAESESGTEHIQLKDFCSYTSYEIMTDLTDEHV